MLVPVLAHRTPGCLGILRLTGHETGDLFGGDPLARAYEIRAAQICYREPR